jgi:hypothetical protein
MKLWRLLFTLILLLISQISGAQSWEPLRNQLVFETDTALLLTDGTAMVHEYNSPNWWRLTPDDRGSYVNGTWSALSSMSSDCSILR